MDVIDVCIFNDEFAKADVVQYPDTAARQITLHSADSQGILCALHRNNGILGSSKVDAEARYLGS